VRLPYATLDERLWREDSLYDIVVVIGFNDTPIVSGKGSAIFLHIARSDYGPTAGCIALSRDDLLDALAQFGRNERLIVQS
jgi:L,D-peptidoglycan transpeptidase YkuD (ErfK/YbiS/YcfS/YnhG family)